MKNNLMKNPVKSIFMAFAVVAVMASCNKNEDISADLTASDDLAYSAARLSAETDSTCKGKKITEIAVADIPAAAKTYISTTYPGATMTFAGKDTDGNFVVGITLVDGTKKGILFTSAGVFKADLKQHGKKAKLTAVATADLPASITAYIKSKYPTATISKAGKNDLGEFFVGITTTVGTVTTKTHLLFDAKGVFVKELAKPEKGPGNDPGHGKGPK